MKTVSVDMWELEYKEKTNELIFFVNPYDKPAVMFTLNAGNINSFLEKVSTPGQKRLVMNGQAMVSITLVYEEQDMDSFEDDDFIGCAGEAAPVFNYRLSDENILPYKIGVEEPYTIEFDDETTRKMVELDVWNHPASDWLSLPQ